MSGTSRAGPGSGITDPEDVKVYHVKPNDGKLVVPQDDDIPLLIIAWNGNGYDLADCWIQIDAEAACQLSSYR
jgi:hypothetical protein